MNKLLWMILLLVLLTPACGSRERPQILTDDARAAVLEYSEPLTDNLLDGFNAGDYATFSRDFTPQMQAALSEDKFPGLQSQIMGKIGAYVSREVQRVEQHGDLVAVVYRATFERDEPVIVRVVFQAEAPHAITGLWFDSAKLRRK